MSRLIHLIYNSAATRPFSSGELEQLLFHSRNKNASVGITGMLLYSEGSFFQVLEGPEDAVEALAATIADDPRHQRMTSIIKEPIARRSFSEWTMGFANVSRDDARMIEGLNDFFGAGHVLLDLDPGRARKLLTAFGHGRWRQRLAGRSVTEPADLAAAVQPSVIDQPRPAFSFAFQPIVNTSTRTVAGYEALVRGLDGQPAAHVLQQVPLEEISAFDEDGRRMALGLASRLGLRSNIHLNVVPMSRLSARSTLDSTIETAQLCGIPNDHVVLELKHEATVGDPEAVSHWLQHHRSTGLKISIDDFGSGYAGLALLDHYQPEMISLSMWLVRGIESHGPRQAIVRGLIQTCGDLGIDIIAKGVETTDEFGWLQEEGIELFQGYLFGRAEFEQLPLPSIPAIGR